MYIFLKTSNNKIIENILNETTSTSDNAKNLILTNKHLNKELEN